jgi:protein TonB
MMPLKYFSLLLLVLLANTFAVCFAQQLNDPAIGSSQQKSAAPSKPDTKVPSRNTKSLTEAQLRKQLLQRLAEIERRVNAENARPRKRYISPATREAMYATYYDKLRRNIEDVGTRNFPEVEGNKLYGELVITMTINHDGSVLDTEVVETSGNKELDRYAESTAKSAGPFETFSEEMRQAVDQVVIVTRFKFTRGDGSETQVAK